MSKENSIFFALSLLLLGLYLGAIIGDTAGQTSYDLKKVAAIVQPVEIDTERVEYETALEVSLSTLDNNKLSSWVDSLVKKGKTGVLPGLPSKFSHPKIIWVEKKPILVK